MNITNPTPEPSPLGCSSRSLVLFTGNALPDPPHLTGGSIRRNPSRAIIYTPLKGADDECAKKGGWLRKDVVTKGLSVNAEALRRATPDFLSLFKFDWLQATVKVEILEVFGWVQSDLGLIAQLDAKPGAHGYAVTQVFAEKIGEKSDNGPLTVLCEHDSRDDVHFAIKGGNHHLCQELMGYTKFKTGGVSRVDVAADLIGDFDGIVLAALAGLPRNMRRSLRAVISFKGGRTIYIGSTKSDFTCRIYEKGLQLLAAGINADPNWVRVEFQFRPGSRLKQAVASLSPAQIAVSCKWGSTVVASIAAYLGGCGPIERVKLIPKETGKTVAEVHEFSVGQYRRHSEQVGLDLATAGDPVFKTLKDKVLAADSIGNITASEQATAAFIVKAYERSTTSWLKSERISWVDPDGEVHQFNPRVKEFVERIIEDVLRNDPGATASRARKSADSHHQKAKQDDYCRDEYIRLRHRFYSQRLINV